MKKISNNDISELQVDQRVVLFGFVSEIRRFKSKTFVDLRDESGVVQIIFEEKPTFTKESVVQVEGVVKLRVVPNLEIPSGKVEVIAHKYQTLSLANTLPFQINNFDTALEDLRLTFRYLDLRKRKYYENLKFRHKFLLEIRNFWDQKGFLEIETPILSKTTPEGARDYLVLTRKQDKFFALPQSPQIFKQLLMCGGFEKYYQIARVFRDEDLRKDRQPEFTQLDIEIAYACEQTIFDLTEEMFTKVLSKFGFNIQTPFPKMTYQEALENYGTDKPDTRFEMLLNDLSEFLVFENQNKKTFGFGLFCEQVFGLEDKKALKLLGIQNNCPDILFLEVDQSGNTFTQESLEVLKKSKLSLKDEIFSKLDPRSKTIVLVTSSSREIAQKTIGALRVKISEILDLVDPNQLNFLWIVDWPFFEKNLETGEIEVAHHPFTDIEETTMENFRQGDLLNVKARSYDCVLNGFELGSGSIRQASVEIQKQIFAFAGLSPQELEEKFGFFLKAFDYGFPQSGGIALGIERILMILTNSSSVREVIAFPKNSKGIDLLCESPARVDETQLEEDYPIFKNSKSQTKA